MATELYYLCSEHAGSWLKTARSDIKEYRNFCEMKASIFVLHITLSTNQKAQKKVYKTFQKNALRSRDGYAKNHSNKVWLELC